jgi:hypothetical protein
MCAKRAGAGIVAGVLAGNHTRERLRNAGATHFIDEIAELPALLAGKDLEAQRAAQHGAAGRGVPGHVAAGRIPPQANAPRTAPAPRVP